MKKQLAVVLGLSVLATPVAFASKARLLALGESTNGSFFINDNRNIFLNAAEVNNHKDLVTFEFGSGANDTDTTPNAEGGVLKAYNNLVYGLHLGRQTSFAQTTAGAGAAAQAGVAGLSSFYGPSNAIDLFVGGDAGIKWGANLTYAKAKDDQFSQSTSVLPGPVVTPGTAKAEAQSIDANLGVIAGDISAYIKAGILGKAEQKSVTGAAVAFDLKRKSDFEVGASYKLSDYTVFGQVNMNKYEEKKSSKDIKNTSATLGAARTERLNDKTTMFVKLSGSYLKGDNELTAPVAAPGDSATKTIAVPVSIGLEHDAASWLVLRGSVAQNLWSKVDSDAKGKSTVANSTNVNAGATLKFGELSVDGVVGTSNGNAINNTQSENGTLSLSNLMTRASVTYRF